MKTTINEQSVECIVLKKSLYKENDCLLSLYTKEYGKISVIARGINKLKSKNARGCQSIVLSDMTINIKKGLSTLIRAEPINYYRHIKEHLDSEIIANYILEYYYRYIDENEPDLDLYTELISCLNAIESGYNPLLVLLIFNIFILNINGLMMEVDGCSICGNTKIISLSLEDGGFMCETHYKGERYDKDFLKAFRHINKLSIDKIDMLHIDDHHIRKLIVMIQRYLEDSTGIRMKSYSFIEEIL